MNNLAIIDQNVSLKIWENNEFIDSVKEVFAKDLSKIEFMLFLELGKAMQLNPFLKEIWAIKYGSGPAQIFIGRDGYRRAAQRHPDYEYHYAEAVYANDIFEAKEGVYNHQFNLKDRGALRGAFCTVKKKSSERPFCLYVPFEEYNKNQTNWKTMPSTMIKKVAEAQCLRMAFQETFGGTYDESEDWKEDRKDYSKDKQKTIDAPQEKPKSMHQVQNENATQAKKEFDIVEDFNSKSENMKQIIEKLCAENIGKQVVDEDFRASFKDEFFVYFKDKYIKSNADVSLTNLFHVQLTAKRLTVLAYKYNAGIDEPLDEKQLNELKRNAFNSFMKDQTQDLASVFIDEANKYVKF